MKTRINPVILEDQLAQARDLANNQNRLLDARMIIEDLIMQDAYNGPLHIELARYSIRLGLLHEALEAAMEAVRLEPAMYDAQALLGAIYLELLEPARSLPYLLTAARLQPNSPEAWLLCGNASYRLGQPAEAKEYLEKALALRPEWPEATCLLGESYLKIGDYLNGWPMLESRWKCAGYGDPTGVTTVPRWNGFEPLDNKTILIIAEQGHGDLIQFARYAPNFKDLGATVVVTAPEELATILKSIRGVDAVSVFGTPLPLIDYQIPLFSVPGAFTTTYSTIPDRIPYVRPRELICEPWRKRFAGTSSRKIGLVWSGSAAHIFNGYRSVTLQQLEPLWAVPNISWFNLQKGPQAEQLKETLTPLIDLSPHLQTYEHTAAVIQQMDLVVTVDTAVAHLTGALGRPGLLMLHAGCDFRWGAVGERTPWYPTLKLIRQELQGEWHTVIERVASELRRL